MPDLSVPNNSGDNLTTTFRHIEEYLYYLAQNGGGTSLPDQTGHAGEFLTTNGSTASWAAITQKIRQVVPVAPKTDTASGTNYAPPAVGGSWVVAYSGSITTTAADSKVIVICCAQVGASSTYQVFSRLQRDGTPLVQGDAAGDRSQTFAQTRAVTQFTVAPVTLVASDTPGSESTHQYDLAITIEANGGTWYLNRTADDSDSAGIPRCATTMFLIEVAP